MARASDPIKAWLDAAASSTGEKSFLVVKEHPAERSGQPTSPPPREWWAVERQTPGWVAQQLRSAQLQL
jgi:hypothetical protein